MLPEPHISCQTARELHEADGSVDKPYSRLFGVGEGTPRIATLPRRGSNSGLGTVSP